ncbi:hypothetical protein V1477_001278 [Vespula maculifrons]|uniref:Uncharacterized protein n=1 Tax=Vespula maculifrons TaxID=7453 RepID=A0ABD2CZC1_VESMC
MPYGGGDDDGTAAAAAAAAGDGGSSIGIGVGVGDGGDGGGGDGGGGGGSGTRVFSILPTTTKSTLFTFRPPQNCLSLSCVLLLEWGCWVDRGGDWGLYSQKFHNALVVLDNGRVGDLLRFIVALLFLSDRFYALDHDGHRHSLIFSSPKSPPPTHPSIIGINFYGLAMPSSHTQDIDGGTCAYMGCLRNRETAQSDFTGVRQGGKQGDARGGGGGGGGGGGEEDGKTHRPIVPAGRQPKSRPLICRSNIREALGWLVGWLVGGKEVPGVRRTPNQSGVHERHEKEGGGREGGWTLMNDTSLVDRQTPQMLKENSHWKDIAGDVDKIIKTRVDGNESRGKRCQEDRMRRGREGKEEMNE